MEQMKNQKQNLVSLKAKSYKLKTNRAFSLVETLVAIAIISIAVIAPMSLAQHSLFASLYARDEVTAFYLAQEAIEYARNVRDDNAITIPSLAGTANWLQGLDNCINQTCGIDPTASGNGNQVFKCKPNTNDCLLTFNSGTPSNPGSDLYGSVNRNNGSNNGWVNTIFTRTLEITPVAVGNDPNAEADLTATVSWQTGSITRSISVSGKLFDWYR